MGDADVLLVVLRRGAIALLFGHDGGGTQGDKSLYPELASPLYDASIGVESFDGSIHAASTMVTGRTKAE